MKCRLPFSAIMIFLGLILPISGFAQRGNIVIPSGASITVPLGARICADTIFANGTGHGTLTLADPSCLCSGSVIIPVELLTFSATVGDGVVLLSWTTATETRNFGFEVQRRINGAWEARGFVEGSGTNYKRQTYRFTDRLQDVAPETARLRYRLKQIDLDGHIDYSPEVEVLLGTTPMRFALEQYPSPCDEELTVRLTLNQPGKTSIRLHDLTGRIVMVIAQEILMEPGCHSLRVQTDQVPSGLYLLVAESSDSRSARKVVIRH